MSENQNSRINNFSKYDEMSTEELEEILRLDAETTEGQESDTDELLYIMEVLTERRKNNGHAGNTAQEAYELFKQHYMPETDNTNTIPEAETTTRKRNLPWMRGLVAAAAVIAILVFSSVTAKAFGVDVWKAIVQWTQEAFHFGEVGESPDEGIELPYASLQEALEHNNISASLAPTWIPDGYELADISVERNPLKIQYRAIYTSGEQILRITVQDFLEEKPVYIEQSEGLVEEYEINGITYYLFSDINVSKAAWINGSYGCDIMGNVTIEELKLMIDSIEKG